MGFQLPITIAQALKQIQSGDLILPAIQREFEWEDEQIVRLFDSVLRGYPIGSFLSWKIDPDTASKFKWYGFLRDYHAKENPHCPVLDIPPTRPVVAVLDGQQRLTALNVGLRGSYADRMKGGWWENPKAFPKRRLYLNVLREAGENDLGMKWDFRLLPEPIPQPNDGSAYWFPIHRVFEIEDISDLMAELAAHGLGNDKYASRLIGDLYKAIHSTGSLYFYEEVEQDIEKVLDIFIRVNSAGTPLSYSDLLLSMATAQWEQRDARHEVHQLVDDLNGTGQGFRFSKDVVLKSGLVLTGVPDFSFKVRNFNRSNTSLLEKQWDELSEALEVATGLLADFGLSESTLTAASVLIPVAHYVHHRGLDQSYRTSPKAKEDRGRLRDWVIHTLVKPGVWGSGLDTLLRELRDVIADAGYGGFPAEQLESRMAARGKALTFSDEEIDSLLETKYGSKRAFPVLALLFGHVDTRNIHHIDHVYPRALLSSKRLKEAGLDRTRMNRIQSLRDLLPNLQLLEGPENVAKKDQVPLEWSLNNFPGEAYHAYLSRNELPDLPAGPEYFEEWFEARRNRLQARFARVLNVVSSSIS